MTENEQYQMEDEISLKEIFQILAGGKYIIAVVTLVTIIIAIAAVIFVMPPTEQTSARIYLNFGSISEGKNPDGTAFSAEQIVAITYIQEVIEKLNISNDSVTANHIRGMIKVQPITPVVAKANSTDIDINAFSPEEVTNFVPNQYLLSIETNRKSDITASQAQIILDSIIYAYKNKFIEKYTASTPAGELTLQGAISEYDYTEALSIIRNRIDGLINTLESRGQNSINFIGSNGYSFADLLASLNLISKIDLLKSEAYTNLNYLTKNSGKYIRNYEYLIKNEELIYNTKNQEVVKSKDMLSTIESSQYLNIDVESLVTAGDESTLSEMLKSSFGNDVYSHVVKQVSAAQTEASRSLSQKDYYTSELANFINNRYNSSNETAKLKTLVSEDIELLYNYSDEMYKKYNELNKEYVMQQGNSMIRVLLDASTLTDYQKSMIIVAAGAFVGLFISAMFVFLKSYFEKA